MCRIKKKKKKYPGCGLCSIAYARLMPQDKIDKVLQNVTWC